MGAGDCSVLRRRHSSSVDHAHAAARVAASARNAGSCHARVGAPAPRRAPSRAPAQRAQQVIAFEPDLPRACDRRRASHSACGTCTSSGLSREADAAARSGITPASRAASRTGAKLRRWATQAPCSCSAASARAWHSPCGRRSRTADGSACSSSGTGGRDTPWPGSTRPRSPPPWRRPWMIASLGTRSTGSWLPSTSTRTGISRRPSTARRIASRVACRMLRCRSPRRWPAQCRTHSALARISSNSSSRRAGAQHLGIGQARRSACRSSRITAAATTGPASGPRPASSTPAIKPGPMPVEAQLFSVQEFVAIASVARARGVAPQQVVDSVKRVGQRVAALPARRAMRSQLRPSACGVASCCSSSGTTNSRHRMLGRPTQGCRRMRFMICQTARACGRRSPSAA